MAPFDQTGFELAPAMKPSRELVPDLPAPVDPVLDTLVKAREWLSDPAHWTKRRAWRDRCGVATEHRHQVGSTCAIGAVTLFFDAGEDIRISVESAFWLDSFVPEQFPAVPEFNDHKNTKHADVLAMYDRAIAARKAA